MNEVMTADESAAMEAMKADPAELAEAPVSQPKPEPEPQIETQIETPAAEPDKPPPGMVPQGALHQERERRKAAEAATQALQDRLAALEAKLNPPPEIVIPDPVLDPKGFKQFQIDQINQRAKEQADNERRQMEAQQHQQVMARLNQDVQAFRATTPDYDTAFQHAVKVRQEELAFYGNAPEQIAAQLETDVQAIVAQAYSQGKNPAELFYAYAKMRGYQTPVAPQPNPAVAQVAALAEAQKQTQSLAPAGGPANDGGMTLETLSRMSEADLAKMPKAQRDEVMRKAMGG